MKDCDTCKHSKWVREKYGNYCMIEGCWGVEGHPKYEEVKL